MIADKELTLTLELASKFSTQYVGIFPKGYVSMLVGEPSAGKTWFMLSMAKGIADGGVGLGSPMAFRQGHVVILAGETGVGLLCTRYKELGFPTNPTNIHVYAASMCTGEDSLCLDTDVGIGNLESIILRVKPEIVFVDTLISFMSSDESDMRAMAEPVRRLTIIAQKTKTALVVCHHFRKKKQGIKSEISLSEVIGSSAFIRLASMVAAITVDGDMRRVQCVKSWWKMFTPFDFIIKSVPTGVYIASSLWSM